MILQSLDLFDEMMVMDDVSGQTNVVSKKLHPEMVAHKLNGHFSRVGGQLICLFRKDGQLQLSLNGETFSLDDESTANIETAGGENIFSLYRQGRLEVQFRYSPKPIVPPLELDLVSSFVEREDFDIFLFIKNVVTDAGRRNRIYS